jgi:hypothetical protein
VRDKTFYALLIATALAAGGCANAYRSSPQAGERPAEARATAITKAAVAETELQEAEGLIVQQRYGEGRRKLAPLAAIFEASAEAGKAARVVFWTAYCYEKEGRTAEAASLYESVTRRYSPTPAARLAADRLARLRAAPAP